MARITVSESRLRRLDDCCAGTPGLRHDGIDLLLKGQLGESHRKELVQAREVLYLVFAPVLGHTTAKRGQRQIEHELRKYELALVHDDFRRKPAKNRQSDVRRSNRDQTETPNSTSKSLTYDVLMCKRWDTTVPTNQLLTPPSTNSESDFEPNQLPLL